MCRGGGGGYLIDSAYKTKTHPFSLFFCLSLLLWFLPMVWPAKPAFAGSAAIATRKYLPLLV